ncbi:MAG: hypothetical protein N4A36_01340 [Candidatus Gracilibacteria bacterium]|jgi:hypothetical protein|nr:hypothetical protein [Candidatus Gracilibacteria bacterium]
MANLQGCCSHHDGLSDNRLKCLDGYTPDKLKNKKQKNETKKTITVLYGNGFKIKNGLIYNSKGVLMVDQNREVIELLIGDCSYIKNGKEKIAHDTIYNAKINEAFYFANGAPITLNDVKNMTQHQVRMMLGSTWDPNYKNNIEIIIRHPGDGSRNFGHTMIKIDGYVYGFYEYEGEEKIHKQSWKTMMDTNFDIQYRNGNDYSFFTLNLPDEKVSGIRKKLNKDFENQKKLKEYKSISNNCTDYIVDDVLNWKMYLKYADIKYPESFAKKLEKARINGDSRISSVHYGSSKNGRFFKKFI